MNKRMLTGAIPVPGSIPEDLLIRYSSQPGRQMDGVAGSPAGTG